MNFGMLKMADDPPFPIFVLFFILILCHRAATTNPPGEGGGGTKPGPEVKGEANGSSIEVTSALFI